MGIQLQLNCTPGVRDLGGEGELHVSIQLELGSLASSLGWDPKNETLTKAAGSFDVPPRINRGFRAPELRVSQDLG